MLDLCDGDRNGISGNTSVIPTMSATLLYAGTVEGAAKVEVLCGFINPNPHIMRGMVAIVGPRYRLRQPGGSRRRL